jgi:hypothetical protein
MTNSVATACMHTDKYNVVCCFLNKKYTFFAIESFHFYTGYATVYLSWSTYINNSVIIT